MTTLRWRGDAPDVAQVVTATPANVEIGDTFLLSINGKSASYAAQAATVADVVAGLVAAIAASQDPEWAEVVATDTGTEVTLTAAVPGRPFTVDAQAINGGAADTQTLTLDEITPSSGPNHWDTPANWSTGSLPAGGDDVYIEDSDVSILYGLDQSAVALASLHVPASFTGQIGLAQFNRGGSAAYFEYRDRFLAIGAGEVHVGQGPGSGSGRVQIDTGSGQAAVTVYASGLSAESNLPAVQWKGTHADNTLDMLDGTVGVALAGGESATIATLRQSGGQVRCGSGVSLSDVELASDASLEIQSAVASIRQSGGLTRIIGTGGAADIELTGGRIEYRSSGTITSVALRAADAVLDFSSDLRPRTVDACTLEKGTVLDPHLTVTWTTGIQPQQTVQAA